MLNEAKISRPRPRPRPESRGRGRDRGQSFEVKVKAEAEANFLRSRPRPRPKIKLWIKSIKWWLTTYRRIYIIMIKTTHFISHFFSFPVAHLSIFYHSVMWSPVVGKVKCKHTGPSISSWLLSWFFCCRLRPGRGQMFEAKTEAEAKALRPRPRPRPKFWPRFGLEDLTYLK